MYVFRVFFTLHVLPFSIMFLFFPGTKGSWNLFMGTTIRFLQARAVQAVQVLEDDLIQNGWVTFGGFWRVICGVGEPRFKVQVLKFDLVSRLPIHFWFQAIVLLSWHISLRGCVEWYLGYALV